MQLQPVQVYADLVVLGSSELELVQVRPSEGDGDLVVPDIDLGVQQPVQ